MARKIMTKLPEPIEPRAMFTVRGSNALGLRAQDYMRAGLSMYQAIARVCKEDDIEKEKGGKSCTP